MKHRLFYNCVIRGDAPPEGYKAAGGLTVDAAFAVYQRGYIARLTEALGDTYESIWRVLGDELFFDVCRKFIAGNPSQSYNLSDYSVKFIDFLISHPVAEEFPFLPDLAHLGWLHKEVFHSAGEWGLSGEELMSRLSEEPNRVRLAQPFEIVKSRYRLFDIWKALKFETAAPAREEWAQSQNVVLYKSDQQVFVREVTAQEAQFFEDLKSGTDVIVACEALAPQEITTLFEFLGSARCLISLSSY